MQKTGKSPRRDFLKLIPLSIVSVGIFSFFKFNRTGKYSEANYKTLSGAEANEIIRNEKFSVSTRINPAPAPDGPKNIKE